ncbi:glycosyltransferase family 25 protein [Brucella pseudogrignonensis]|jgi:GR25 family glycosyltransferase involved in LPS biosynthesis|uniref:Glycosyltransferase 25 family protein n=1 Tax=Brucella pseudogrignonensis TaxID=419475 RepID=A0A256GLA5_9HYPH|nr:MULTISPECIES: glycosyltransferase family 25 protein [Brucella]EMG55211.1 glycosyl transferase family protein [Ochrobactrum sp. CDB2]MBK0020300.1 glycosyltransferase family 25 protein [Ochrobactrum sp. S45]MBK0042960.1 glycosyltransferase family 25 protein [Ochrobactrum sp. S46]NNV21053.1 glycosyltransferase family 25 protein [Brucella pseudogrignonensis]OYR27788.1 glycosyltransferase 25 family protein [Brucella pseudogrignonensis]
MNIKAFIIHLARSTDRGPQVDKLIRELPVKTEVIDAVDSRALADAEIKRVYRRKLHAPRYPFELSKNEIACFLSHRKAWQAIVDQKLDAGFIIEDDIELTAVFNAAFHAVTNHFEPGSFVRFTFRDDREHGREVFRNDQIRIIIPNPIGLGMVAQLVSFDAAQKLLAATEQFDRPVDTTVQMRWVTGLQPLAVIPGGVKEISAQLGGTTIQHKKSFSDKLAREILRPIYRMRVRRFSARSK